MITHKIRIYPNQSMQRFFEEQFEFARRDYNRQLEMLVMELKAGRVSEENHLEILKRIRAFAFSRAGFYHAHSFHFPDIIAWNSKRLIPFLRAYFQRNVKPVFLGKGRGLSAFRLFAGAKTPSFSFPEPKRLQLDSHGTIKMAESPRFSSEPLCCTIEKKNGRYWACLLFREESTPYPKTGKSIGIAQGLRTTLSGLDSDGKQRFWDLNLKRISNTMQKAKRLTKRIRCKMEISGDAHPSSHRFEKVLRKLQNLRQKQINQKANFIEQTSHTLLTRFDLIAIEPFSEAKARTKRGFGRAFQTAKTYASLLHRLLIKGPSTGKIVWMEDRGSTFSRTCAECGSEWEETRRTDRKRKICPVCGAKISFDLNAATNLLRKAQKSLALNTQVDST